MDVPFASIAEAPFAMAGALNGASLSLFNKFPAWVCASPGQSINDKQSREVLHCFNANLPKNYKFVHKKVSLHATIATGVPAVRKEKKPTSVDEFTPASVVSGGDV